MNGRVRMARVAGIAIVGMLVAAGLTGAASAGEPTAKKTGMTVTSSGIVRGKIADAYGARGKTADGVPVVSLPLTVRGAPRGTVAYAVLMTDPDAKAVGGIEFRHWMAVNIPTGKIAKNASVKRASTMIQGLNDYGTAGYGGPNPPDKTHRYVITVYALGDTVDLDDGFDLSIKAFQQKIKASVLAKKTIRGTYSPAS